jgi:hypothetical protein
MKKYYLFFLVAVLLTACGNRRLSPEVLQQKIDSVYALEKLEELKRQGVNLEDASPFQLFYDSLDIQALPMSYSEDYMKILPNYQVVPQAIMSFLELEGRIAPKAIALPETIGARLVLLAADVADGEYELWLYSLDSDCYPVDKLLLYQPQVISDSKLTLPPQETYFSITSNYEIRVMEYADESDEFGQLSTFIVDDARMFVEQR